MEKVEKKSNIVRNIAIGVAVGAAVTMMKKSNRNKLASNVRKAKTKMIEIRENPTPLKDRVKESVQAVGIKGRELADFTAVKEKMGEFKKLKPAVVETLKETCDIFNKKKQDLKEQNAVQAEEAIEELEVKVYGTEELKNDAEPVVAEDGGMAETRELMMNQQAEEKTEELVAEKKDEPKNEALVGDKNEKEAKKQTV
jgi:hypothetical protein